ncbi:CatB-related O-acetyltransferase [Spirosoma flavum]|uniref:CatB-related O-acetyltransferase n=1 Tax=Spirosoma flavum TaxID=2048557 RepID=A0ABW6ASQ7_9BACT
MRIIKKFFNIFFDIQLFFYQRIMLFLFNSIKECRISSRAVISKSSSFYNVGIGINTYLASNARINNTEIGKFCSVGPNLLCGFGIHPINGISTSPSFYSLQSRNGLSLSSENKIEEYKTTTIGNDVFIGANVTILDGVTIGDGAVIGAGAVVSKNIPPYAIAIGCPIKVVKYRYPEEIINQLIEIKWWDKDDTVWKSVEKNFYNIEDFIKAQSKNYNKCLK